MEQGVDNGELWKRLQYKKNMCAWGFLSRIKPDRRRNMITSDCVECACTCDTLYSRSWPVSVWVPSIWSLYIDAWVSDGKKRDHSGHVNVFALKQLYCVPMTWCICCLLATPFVTHLHLQDVSLSQVVDMIMMTMMVITTTTITITPPTFPHTRTTSVYLSPSPTLSLPWFPSTLH